MALRRSFNIQRHMPRALRRLIGDRRGSMVVLTALMMPVVMGFSALGVDATAWYMQRRNLQTVADAAAVAAAYHAVANAAPSQIGAAAMEDANRNGYAVGPRNRLIVHAPPQTGPYAGRPGFVEVLADSDAEFYFVGAFLDRPVAVTARAVAGGVAVGEHCVVALDENADRALEFSGTANVNLDCGVASNSRSLQAIYVGGNASLTADPAQAYGDIQVSGNARLHTKHPPQPYSQRVPDPYGPGGRDLQLPPSRPCDANNFKPKGGETLSPGRYCGGLQLKGNITFKPGVYEIYDGGLQVNGNANLVGDGVTFVLNGSSPNKVGTIKINGGTKAALSAPTSGHYAGVLFFQTPNASSASNLSNDFLGGANMRLDGALYFPNQEVKFSGGAGSDPACLQIAGRKVTFTGSGYLSNDADFCKNLGVEEVAQIRVRLVE